MALLAKWWWKFAKERDALWRRVISHKYGLASPSWTLLPVTEDKLSIMMKGLWMEKDDQLPFKAIVASNLHVTVGNGVLTSFWNDPWAFKTDGSP